MCGILVAVNHEANDCEPSDATWEELKDENARRGPDRSSTLLRQTNDGVIVRLFASELQLRGEGEVSQPHLSVANGDVLCWNGEVFQGLEIEGSSQKNDGVLLMARIQESANLSMDLPEIFDSIEGPYAFVYFHNATKTMYFARDPLGRRSLLVHPPSQKEPFVLLASVSVGLKREFEFLELSTEGIFCMRLGEWTDIGSPPPVEVLRPYNRSSLVINKLLPESPPMLDPDNLPCGIVEHVDAFVESLRKSVELRVSTIPTLRNKDARLAVLFSGGIDSAILALLADSFVPDEEPIDLLNVAFENPRKLYFETAPPEEKTGSRKNRAVHVRNLEHKTASYDVPDRLTGREELDELRKLRPNRKWNFVEIDVPYEESSSKRMYVENLMYPQRTVMDMSLGLALFYASRGIGHVRVEGGTNQPYISAARVLLSGLGSDELGGGYMRHRTAFDSGGWSALVEELQLEINRIPTRNLGRDDRIVSSHGKELRLPFLSLSVVKYCANLPVHFKADPRLPQGVGDKLLMREAARRLGMTLASRRKKRAMQFGTRSAKMELDNPNERRGDLLVQSSVTDTL